MHQRVSRTYVSGVESKTTTLVHLMLEADVNPLVKQMVLLDK